MISASLSGSSYATAYVPVPPTPVPGVHTPYWLPHVPSFVLLIDE